MRKPVAVYPPWLRAIERTAATDSDVKKFAALGMARVTTAGANLTKTRAPLFDEFVRRAKPSSLLAASAASTPGGGPPPPLIFAKNEYSPGRLPGTYLGPPVYDQYATVERSRSACDFNLFHFRSWL